MRRTPPLVRRHLGLMPGDLGVEDGRVCLDPDLAVLQVLAVMLGKWDQSRVTHGIGTLPHVLDELVSQPLLLDHREGGLP